MEINWISHACFRITSGDVNIYTDPYQVQGTLPGASLILVSHDHHDHADAGSIKKLMTGSTTVICPKSCIKKLAKYNPVGIDPAESKEVQGVKITGFPSCTFPGKPFHPRENKWLGFIIELEGKKVYHAGDTDIIEDMKDLKSMNLDVALLPVGNKGFTMDFNDAAKATGYIMPKIMVPMHDWDQDLEPLRALVKEEAPGVVVEILRNKSLSL
ncbi:MAG: MBL fold metallo-hydrolase [Candidatus Hodarchaeota archaeon]